LNADASMKTFFLITTIGLMAWLTGPPAGAQAPPPAPAIMLRSAPDLDQLIAPVALYPDPLIAELLPAATQPTDVVMADRYLRQGGDPNLLDAQPWSPSAKALARYPSVLAWMDDNINWTTQIGDAFRAQEADVMSSIQRLRARALAVGNLRSTPQQTVINDGGLIEILPATPDMIYVPSYQPEYVYYTPGYYLSFGVGLPIGIWLNHDWDWRGHRIIAWHRDHPRPRDWWYRPPGRRVIDRDVAVWRPRDRIVVRNEDRGWERPEEHRAVAAPERGRTSAPVERRREVEVRRAAPTPAPRPEIRRNEDRGALLGTHGARETHESINRGTQSRQAAQGRPGRGAPGGSGGAARGGGIGEGRTHEGAGNRGGHP
jgi:hypothetical protein